MELVRTKFDTILIQGAHGDCGVVGDFSLIVGDFSKALRSRTVIGPGWFAGRHGPAHPPSVVRL